MWDKVVRVLAGYDRQTDDLVEELVIEDFPLKRLQEIYEQPPFDPLPHCYPLNEVAWESIKEANPSLRLRPDLDYMIESFLPRHDFSRLWNDRMPDDD
ncbi:MAG: hypothetical protein AAGJ97_12705 [Planctomycetota bacterium]